MGRRGPLGKGPDRQQGHRAARAELTLITGPVEPPRPPAGILKPTREAWVAYWSSDVARVTTEVDLPAIRRLFRMYDQLERATQVVRKAMAVRGSTGQIRVNPLADYALKLDTQILRLESELGLTPMARMRLGIATGAAMKSLEEINAAFESDHDDDDEADEEDPRLRAIDTVAR